MLKLTSEHFKLSIGALEKFLLDILDYMVRQSRISPILKECILSPILKKGDKSNPSNYRGIAVTPVILKILEHVLNKRHNQILLDSQSRLQQGFIAGSSPLGAALILTECINEAKNKREPLFVAATLDVQKALDVVDRKCC